MVHEACDHWMETRWGLPSMLVSCDRTFFGGGSIVRAEVIAIAFTASRGVVNSMSMCRGVSGGGGGGGGGLCKMMGRTCCDRVSIGPPSLIGSPG